MASIVVGALLSASVKLVLQNIVSSDFVNFSRRTKLDVSLLENLKITLLSLQAVLNDAEEKQITNPAVKEWLVMLQDAVFEVDNLFDEINTEALRRKVEAKHEGQTLSGKVHNIFSSHVKLFKRNINSKMHKLFERLEYLRQQNLGLKESVDVYTPTYSFLGEKSSICGRDDDIKKLKDLLFSEGTSDIRSKVGVISIVGMGGLGKTTLAKLLYSDPEVKEKFELRGWAYISKDFDVFKITKTL
ncbi:CC-NBS-LRR resistance protein, partial [Trifolium pratense]